MERLTESLRRTGALLEEDEVIFCDGRRVAAVCRRRGRMRVMVLDKYGLFKTRRVASLEEARGVVEALTK